MVDFLSVRLDRDQASWLAGQAWGLALCPYANSLHVSAQRDYSAMEWSVRFRIWIHHVIPIRVLSPAGPMCTMQLLIFGQRELVRTSECAYATPSLHAARFGGLI